MTSQLSSDSRDKYVLAARRYFVTKNRFKQSVYRKSIGYQLMFIYVQATQNNNFITEPFVKYMVQIGTTIFKAKSTNCFE